MTFIILLIRHKELPMKNQELEETRSSPALPPEFNIGLDYGYYKSVYLPVLCRELLLFGSTRLIEVLDKYQITAEDFELIVELPLFKKEMRELKAISEASPNALIQMKAREYVDQGLDYLWDIVRFGKDRDKIAAMKFLSEVGGTQETGGLNRNDESSSAKQASGLTLNVNFGPGGLIPPLPTEQRPLRSVKQIREIIDVTPTK